MRTFYEIAQSSPPVTECLINAIISGGLALVVILIVLIVRLMKGSEKK